MDGKIKKSIIVAMARNNVIGRDNDMPWHLPEDLKHFKSITMGKPCIMGRNTFESIVASLGKPLPGRVSVVVSSSMPLDSGGDNVVICRSVEEAIERAESLATDNGNDEVMIIGGAMIYRQSIGLADYIYLTLVDGKPEGDAFFPDIPDDFQEVEGSVERFDGYCFKELSKQV